MAISELVVSGYRSIQDLTVQLKQLNVLAGPNGCGKTNLYRSMVLLQAAADGRFAASLASEGGMPSVLWAGSREKGPVRLKLGVTAANIRYQIECGLPQSHNITKEEQTKFRLDPQIKEEGIWFKGSGKPVKLLERGSAGTCWATDESGRRAEYRMAFGAEESVLCNLLEPHRFPQVVALRKELLSWRFYHHFRTDEDSAIRKPQVGTRTPVLTHNGRDLAAALQTIIENGDDQMLRESIDAAFPGGRLNTTIGEAFAEADLSLAADSFLVSLTVPGLQRPMLAQELSDGTLRYLCLLAALLSPRPPSVLAINEPETSLHPDLIEPLAKLIVRAAERAQIWVTTHSVKLADSIERLSGVKPIALEKVNGETQIAGRSKYFSEED